LEGGICKSIEFFWGGVITHEQARILTAFANQAALALERVMLTENATHDRA